MLGTTLIGVLLLDDVIVVRLLGPFVMAAKFRGGIKSVLLVGGSGGGMLGGIVLSGSELANSGGGGMKDMTSKPLYCPDGDIGDAILVGFLIRMLLEGTEGSGLE